jgi:hypothetical protein
MDRDEAIRLLKGGPESVREWNRRRNSEEAIHVLSRADSLRRADLREADFHWADLSRAQLSEAICGKTAFPSIDLSQTKGLETVRHSGPSTVGIDTLFLSEGKLPGVFFRGCGLSLWEVLAAKLYSPELTPPGLCKLQNEIFDAWTKGRSMINGCFVSYSWADATFVDKLSGRLMAEGVNVWLDRHDTVHDIIPDQDWTAIQVHRVVIIVLSKDSVVSRWVKNKLAMAPRTEKAEKRAVLCPICVDDAWKVKVEACEIPGEPSRQLWRTLQQKLVVDFSGWETNAFEESFQKLVRGLKTNYGPGASASK